MQLDLKDVVGSQKYAGQKIWICDYRKDIDKKADRHVKPTEVYVAGDKDFADAGLEPRIYYSDVGFAKLNKKGEPLLKQLISPYDTTGYRSYAGIGVYAFDNEAECIDMYNSQVQAVVEKYENHMRYVMLHLAETMQEIKDLTITRKE